MSAPEKHPCQANAGPAGPVAGNRPPESDEPAADRASADLPDDRLDSLDRIAAGLLFSLPALFHARAFWPHLSPLTLHDVRTLFLVFTATLILVGLLRGLAAVRQLMSFAVAISVAWIAIFQYVVVGLYSTRAAVSYMIVLLFALILHWHLLPLYLLDHLERRAKQIQAAMAGPNGEQARSILRAVAGSQRLGWILSGLIGACDVWFLLVLVNKGPHEMWRLPNLALGLAPALAVVALGMMLLHRLSRHEVAIRVAGLLSEPPPS